MVGQVLFVHAHPDDESISTGGTIAALVDAGRGVTVLTLTRGERGEVIPADLRHLEGSPELARWRERELAEALGILGVTDHRFLGDPGARRPGLPPRRYVDSGMQWGADGAEPADLLDPASVWAAPLAELAADVGAVIDDIDADLVISYDERGGYGHPDHIRAHQAARAAAEERGLPFLAVEPMAERAVHHVDVSAVWERKRAAMAAHRTQLTVDGDFFALSNGVSAPIGRVESFRPVWPGADPEPVPFDERSRGYKLLAALGALALGGVVGAMGTIAHQALPPLGIGLALLASAGLLAALRVISTRRALTGTAAVGLLAAASLLALPGQGGSVLVPANPAGYAWTFGPVLICVLALAWPRLDRGGASRMGRAAQVKDQPAP